MAEFGKFTELTFINDNPPALNAGNLNEMQRVLNLSDDELSRSAEQKFKFYKEYFWQRNCKFIDDFNSVTGWAADASTTISADTTNFLVGIQSMKFLENDNTAGWIGMSKALTATNLDTFNDASSANDSNHIMWCFYISDKTKFTHIQFKLGTDNSNNYAFLYTASSLRNGWNCVYDSKDSAIVAGAPDWANITYIRCEATTPAGSINAYISVQLCMLYRYNPDTNTYYTPFQKYLSGGSFELEGPEITLDTWAYYYDPVVRDLGIMMLDTRTATGNEKGLHIYCSIINFIAKFEVYCKSAGSSPSFTWAIDTNNYIEGYISSDTLYLDFVEGGATTSYNIALTNALILNERYQIGFEKEGQTVRIILYKDGENIKILEKETSISITADGCLYLGCKTTGCNGFLTNYQVSNRQIKYDSWDTPKVVLKTADQIINNSTVFIDCDDMYVDLPPNSMFLIDAYIASFNATTDAADIKFVWASTGDVTQLKGNRLFAMPTNITSCLDGNLKATVVDLTTTTTVGHDGTSSETLTRESFLVYTKNVGGRVQLQFAQNTANASDTIVDNQSFMIVTKLKK